MFDSNLREFLFINKKLEYFEVVIVFLVYLKRYVKVAGIKFFIDEIRLRNLYEIFEIIF